MSETSPSSPAPEAVTLDPASEAVAAPPAQDASVPTLIQIPLPAGTAEMTAAPPERPAEGSLHDIVAWLEARLAWLESTI